MYGQCMGNVGQCIWTKSGQCMGNAGPTLLMGNVYWAYTALLDQHVICEQNTLSSAAASTHGLMHCYAIAIPGYLK